MTKVQIISTEGGEQLAVLPLSEYERLAALDVDEVAEDAGTARVVDRALRAIAQGRDVLLPEEVHLALEAGENPVRVLRKWRGLSQADLAAAIGRTQSYVANMEAGRRDGTTETMVAVAGALGIPMEVLLA